MLFRKRINRSNNTHHFLDEIRSEVQNEPGEFASDYCFTDHPTLGAKRFPSFPTLPNSLKRLRESHGC